MAHPFRGPSQQLEDIASRTRPSERFALQTRVFATWIGWSSVVIALALLVGWYFWTDQIVFGPYVLYWIWLIVISVILFIRARAKG